VTFGGGCSAAGTVELENGDRKSCLATVVIQFRNACIVRCNMAQDLCKQQHPGADTDRDCVDRRRECIGDCASPP
ncbi:MAG TPA: hypothetical protein VN923_19885, partial [Thermoanaerobaculia bacterium]|nr:hypothetical protein [Thermoanaerobaculia bacterium]